MNTVSQCCANIAASLNLFLCGYCGSFMFSNPFKKSCHWRSPKLGRSSQGINPLGLEIKSGHSFASRGIPGKSQPRHSQDVKKKKFSRVNLECLIFNHYLMCLIHNFRLQCSLSWTLCMGSYTYTRTYMHTCEMYAQFSSKEFKEFTTKKDQITTRETMAQRH